MEKDEPAGESAAIRAKKWTEVNENRMNMLLKLCPCSLCSVSDEEEGKRGTPVKMKPKHQTKVRWVLVLIFWAMRSFSTQEKLEAAGNSLETTTCRNLKWIAALVLASTLIANYKGLWFTYSYTNGRLLPFKTLPAPLLWATQESTCHKYLYIFICRLLNWSLTNFWLKEKYEKKKKHNYVHENCIKSTSVGRSWPYKPPPQLPRSPLPSPLPQQTLIDALRFSAAWNDSKMTHTDKQIVLLDVAQTRYRCQKLPGRAWQATQLSSFAG